jgi:hypothetical protein
LIVAAPTTWTGEHLAAAPVAAPGRLCSTHSSTTGGSPLAPIVDETMKSGRTAGGVILLDGRGPFHAFSRIDGLGKHTPGGEEDAGLRPTSRLEVLGGDDVTSQILKQIRKGLSLISKFGANKFFGLLFPMCLVLILVCSNPCRGLFVCSNTHLSKPYPSQNLRVTNKNKIKGRGICGLMAISTNNVICPIYFTQMVKPSINPTNIKGTQNHDPWIKRNKSKIKIATHMRLGPFL